MVKKIFSCQRGFSLMDAIIAGLLLGGFTLGALKLSDLQTDGTAAGKTDLSRYSTMVREYISDPKACSLNFVGKRVDQIQSLDFLMNSREVKIVEVGDQVDIYKVTSIQIEGYKQNTQRLNVSITFLAEKQIPGLAPQIKHHFNLFVRPSPSGNTVGECVDPFGLTTEELIDNLCYDADPERVGNCNKNFNSLVDQVKQKYCQEYSPFLDFNDATKKCYALDATKECVGGFVKGYNASGPVCFYPPASGPATVPPPPSVDCSINIGDYEWGVEPGNKKCVNTAAIHIVNGDDQTINGGQTFEWGPPYTSAPRPETICSVRLRCDNGVPVIVGTPHCVRNCIVRTLNHRFPPPPSPGGECLTNTLYGTYTFSAPGYGIMNDFVRIPNGQRRRLLGVCPMNFTEPLCRPDGTVEWPSIGSPHLNCTPGPCS
jgi:hypothetical protein